jgi:hypothetical protein
MYDVRDTTNGLLKLYNSFDYQACVHRTSSIVHFTLYFKLLVRL